MAIEKDHIEHLADLARLGITEAEKKKYAEQISSILDYCKQLEEINTQDVEPLSHVHDLEDVLREDKVQQTFSQEKVLAEAPALEKNQIKVHKVLE